MRKGLAIFSTIAIALVVAGCTPMFDGPITGKQVTAKKVQIKFEICRRTSSGENVCSDAAPRVARRGGFDRHLLGFRVPKGTEVPREFESLDGTFEYGRLRQYTRELKRLAPTPAGTRWVGFNAVVFDDDPERAAYRLKFGIPADHGQVFKYRPVTGFASESAEIDCGNKAIADEKTTKDQNAVCISDPTTIRKVRRSLKIQLD